MAVKSLTNGFECLKLVSQVVTDLQINPKAVEIQLGSIKAIVPTYLDQIKGKVQEFENKSEDLKRREYQLERNINDKEREQDSLRKKNRGIEVDIARERALLNDFSARKRRAESDKQDAENKKDAAVAGTIGGAAAAVTLGVIFPPSLFITVPTVAAVGTTTIVVADKEISSCRERISSLERSISRSEADIRSNNTKIDRNNDAISELKVQQTRLVQERGELRETIVFLLKGVEYFELLRVGVEGGESKTSTLQNIVKKVNAKQKFKVFSSKGGEVVVNSFVEAWKQVESKLLDGDGSNFLAVKFN